MKRLCLLISLIFATTLVHSQEIVDLENSLDSLKRLRATYQAKIYEIDREYKIIENIINEKRLDLKGGETFYTKSKTVVRNDLTRNDIIGTIPLGAKVKVIGQNATHYNIWYNNGSAWVLKDALVSEKEMNSRKEAQVASAKAKEEAALKAEEDKEKEAAKRKEELVKKYGITIAQDILSGKIWLG